MMGRMTAYDQNGRMISDFDKSDYDFLCSYGLMPEEVLEENAKLRKQYEAVIADYRSEVAKLRELVWDMYGNYRTGWNEVIEEELYNRMLELGVVDE